MRTAFDEEIDEMDHQPAQADREVTLSSTTLLAIFFGLVLVCGLFFGLGYTLGRRAPSDAADLAAASESTATPQPVASLPISSQPKPSAAAQNQTPIVTAAPPDSPAPVDEAAAEPDQQATPAPTTPHPALQPAAVTTTHAATPPAQVKPAIIPPAASAAVPAPPAGQTIPGPATGTMVQIAAVSNPADANVLVSALHNRGYSVAIRHQATDSLLHVQVGPFSNRADALAMRQKLLADGYNAILK